MTQGEFEAAIGKLAGEDLLRGELYYRALDLVKSGFVIEAHLLILATWNFARFRYVTRSFNLGKYENTVKSLAQSLQPITGCEFMSADLLKHKPLIVDAFDALAEIEGIKFTGAAKILHLLQPQFFVMWDRFISGQYPKRCYLNLPIVRSGFWSPCRFRSSGDGYFSFLLECQKRFRGLTSPDTRTMAKCIDEFNFNEITFPIAQAQRTPPDVE